MRTFIKVIEIWTPDTDSKNLTLSDSYYGQYDNFNTESKKFSFAYNEGLPGTAWAQSKPIVITDLDHSCFQRKTAARDSGITCAIALPIFAGQFLLSVVVFLCGDEEELQGAIEVWAENPELENELQLVDGYYGSLEKLEWISRRISFQKGKGLPGNIWDYHIPVIITDLPSSSTFLRASNAQLAGITTAFGIPFIFDKKREFVISFLSAKGTPIARRFEIWLPDRDHKHLLLHQSHSDIPDDTITHREITKGEGYIGQTWLTGCPVISHTTENDNNTTRNDAGSLLMTSVAIPIIEDGILTAVIALTL